MTKGPRASLPQLRGTRLPVSGPRTVRARHGRWGPNTMGGSAAAATAPPSEGVTHSITSGEGHIPWVRTLSARIAIAASPPWPPNIFSRWQAGASGGLQTIRTDHHTIKRFETGAGACQERPVLPTPPHCHGNQPLTRSLPSWLPMVETLPECCLPLTLLPAGLLEGQGSSRDGCCSQHTVSNASVRVTSLPLSH